MNGSHQYGYAHTGERAVMGIPASGHYPYDAKVVVDVHQTIYSR